MRTIVSLSPAATDLMLAMNVGDRVVGVSTYDADPRVSGRPRVGDYENVDWERIRDLAPRTLITQVPRDRLPAGFLERAAAIGCDVQSIRIDRLQDIGDAALTIGRAIGEEQAAADMWSSVRARLDDIAEGARHRPRARTLIVTSDDALSVAGPNTFLDDLLQIAGGVNAVGEDRPGYFKLDREQLLSIDPEAIVMLLPGARPDVQASARNVLAGMPRLRAVREGRIVIITRDDVLQPNANVAATAAEMAAAIEGGPTR